MAYGGKDEGLKTQRRDRLDGGLNSRRAPFLLEEGQVSSIKNLVFQEEGSLVVRKFAGTLLQTTWAGSGLLPAPVLTQIVGGGSLAAGDYTAQYGYPNNPSGFSFNRYTSPSANSTPALTVNLNDRIQIDIFPNNLGEGQGQASDGADDPFNGFVPQKSVLLTTSQATFKKTGDPNFTIQASLGAFAWNTSARCQRATLTAYANTGALLAPLDHNFPLRFVFWNPAIQAMIGITVDKAILFAGDFSSFTRFGIANDKAGNAHYWSRLPTRMNAAYLEQIPIISDNLSRPKRMHWTGSAATSNWRLLGANAPAAVPTVVVNAVAGNLNGNYFYKVAYVFRDGRGDLTTLDIESNATATSLVVAPANQKVDVTIPGTSETGLNARRVYRTKAGGTVFFFHSDQAAGTGNLTFTDNTADTGLGTDTPVNDVGKDPNDVPPNKLAYLTSHKGRLFAFESNYLVDAQNRIIDFIATSRLRLTKAAAAGTSESINAWPSTFPVFICGNAAPPTGLISHRGTLYFFKASTIGQLAGNDETDYIADVIFEGVGAMRNSILSVGSLIFFWEDARGAMTFNGVSYDPIGFVIQPTWDADRDAGFYVFGCWFNQNLQQIHWVITNLNIAPATAGGTALAFKEYVFYIPTKAWTIIDASDSGTNVDVRSTNSAARAVLAADINRQVYTQVIGNMNGVACQEAKNVANSGPSPDGNGTAVIQVYLKVFFGDDWEMTKTVRALELYTKINGASSTIAVAVATLTVPNFTSGTDAFVTIGTLSYDNSRQYDRVDVVDIPQDVMNDAIGFDKVSQDRGLRVRLTFVQLGAESSIVRGCVLHYKDVQPMRRAP